MNIYLLHYVMLSKAQSNSITHAKLVPCPSHPNINGEVELLS